MRAVQRAGLWAMTGSASQAALVGLEIRGIPVPFGGGGVMAAAGEQGKSGAGRELHLSIAADGNDGGGVAAAVGPHGAMPGCSGPVHPSHRLPQEIGGSPRRVVFTLSQPCHQHVAGAGSAGQPRVIAPIRRHSCDASRLPFPELRP